MPQPASQQSAENVSVVFCSCPDAASAAELSAALVKEGLAACVSALPGVISTYTWQDELRRDDEVMLLIKTTSRQVDELEKRISALHPYELPEILTVPDCGGSEAYLEWIRTSVKTDR